MHMHITLMYASIFAVFALVLSFRAGSFRGKSGVSVLFGEPGKYGARRKSSGTPEFS